jgi:peptide chain release factor 3
LKWCSTGSRASTTPTSGWKSCQYTGARWITADTPQELKAFTDAYPMRMALDAADTLAYPAPRPTTCGWRRNAFPKIHFHPLREHAGLALQTAG